MFFYMFFPLCLPRAEYPVYIVWGNLNPVFCPGAHHTFNRAAGKIGCSQDMVPGKAVFYRVGTPQPRNKAPTGSKTAVFAPKILYKPHLPQDSFFQKGFLPYRGAGHLIYPISFTPVAYGPVTSPSLKKFIVP